MTGLREVLNQIPEKVRKFESANLSGFKKAGKQVEAYLRIIIPKSPRAAQRANGSSRPHLADDQGSKAGKFRDGAGFWMLAGAHFKRQPHDHLVEDGTRPRYGANEKMREAHGFSRGPDRKHPYRPKIISVMGDFSKLGGGRSRIGGKFAFANKYDADGRNITPLHKLQTGRMPAFGHLKKTMVAMSQRVVDTVYETVKSRLGI